MQDKLEQEFQTAYERLKMGDASARKDEAALGQTLESRSTSPAKFTQLKFPNATHLVDVVA